MKWSVVTFIASFYVLHVFCVPVEESDEIREKRGLMGVPGAGLYGGPSDPDSPVYSAPVSYAGGPMSPYLAMKPFLPPKPFASPFVDPNYFIAQKAKLLGGIFPPQTTTIDDFAPIQKRQAPGPANSPQLLGTTGDVPPQQMIMSSDFWMYPTPPPKPTIVPPGYWSPFGAGPSPSPGPVDPSVFISKKTKFLSDLFAAKAVSTPAPPTLDPTDIYSAKVDEFLAKLSDALNITLPPKAIKREVSTTENSSDSTDPKDKVLSSILDELSNIKNSMLATAAEIIKQQQTVASTASKAPKKPPPPPGSIGAYWAAKSAAASAAADPLAPYQKRLETLGQVFDMLTQLEKDLTTALQVPTTTTTQVPPTTPEPQVNITELVAALRKAQSSPIGGSPMVLGPAYPPTGYSGLYVPSMRKRRSSEGYYARDYPGQVYPQKLQQQYQQYQSNVQNQGKERKNKESEEFNYNILEYIQNQLNRRHHHHH